MFVFDDDYRFDWPVRVDMPAEGGVVSYEFTAVFRLVEEDELFVRRPADEPPEELNDLLAAERATLARRLVGWRDIGTPGGENLPYSEEARDRLLRQRPIREAVARAYYDAVLRGGVAEKN